MDAIMEETKAPETAITPAPAESPKEPDYITIDDFTKVDLRVAEIVEAEHIEGADKLLRIKLNLGDESREVMAGIKLAYKPEDLKGRLVVCVANLKPRKMKFGTSEGMILATGTGGENLFLLSPDTGAKPGQKVS